MSVDDIIQAALVRRDRERQSARKQPPRQASPPTHEFQRSAEKDRRAQTAEGFRGYEENVTPKQIFRNRDHSGSGFQRTPQPVFTSQQDLKYDQNTSKLYDEDANEASENNFIEKKVEEVLKKFIGNSQLSSIQGSRESSLPRGIGTPEQMWTMNQAQYQPQFANSYNTMQPMFNSIPDMSQQSNFLQLKKQIDDLQVSLTEKDAEIIWLNMKLGDEKRSASRTTLQRDISTRTLHKDASRNSFMGYESSKYNLEQQIEALTKEKDKLEKRVKELELSKIKLEKENDDVTQERDNLKIQISYLQSAHKDQSSNGKLDVMLENKLTKQKLLEVKEDYGKLLNENLQYKERWEKEKKVMDEFRNSMDKHQEDVKKAM